MVNVRGWPPPAKDGFIFDPSLVLYLPLYELDGAKFQSKDAYGHLCTVSGALWTPQGRWFDVINDTISIGATKFDTLANGTLEIWFKTDLAWTPQVLFSHYVNGGNRNYIFHQASSDIGVHFAVAGIYYQSGFNTTLAAPAWHHIVWTFGSGGSKIYVDSVKETTENATTLGWSNMGTSTGNHIGSHNGTDTWFGGIIGEVRIYNRALSPLEIQRNYLATRGRYA